MARIKGPNGLVLTVPDGIAADLVRSPAGDYAYADDEPQTKRTSAKSPKK